MSHIQSGQCSSNCVDVSALEQRLASSSEDNPSQLEKQQRNRCIISQSQNFPISSILETQFQRYSKPSQRFSTKTNSKVQHVVNEPSLDRTLSKSASANDCYVDWKVYKNKPNLNMLPFPYCIQQSIEYKKPSFSPLSLLNPVKLPPKQPSQQTKKVKELPKIYKLKIQNKIKIYTGYQKENKTSKPYFNFEKTPINEYLNYELAEQINTGLREVQIMAEEIKRIKKAKKIANQDDSSLKQKHTKGLRIRRSYIKNFRGIYKTNTNI